MTDAAAIAATGSWIATGLGLGLWAWSWLGEKNPLRKQRLYDCGAVLVFSAVIVRLAAQSREMNMLEWALMVFSPLVVVAALWRLARTGGGG